MLLPLTHLPFPMRNNWVKGHSHPSETIHMARKAFPKTIFQRNFIIL